VHTEHTDRATENLVGASLLAIRPAGHSADRQQAGSYSVASTF
jgi:hypothetical protein